MIKRVLLIFFSFLCLTPVFSQEGLRSLGGRISSLETEPRPIHQQHNNSNKRTQAAGSLQLPFLDDFYYASFSLYPNPNLWQDSMAYVNTGFPIAPPSIGVATFDGLNKHGYPYKPTQTNLILSDSADKLTTQPINLRMLGTHTLTPGDSVALTFYYQATGNGESPEEQDSLLLDFYSPGRKTWYNMWGSPGVNNSNITDTTFKRGFVWVKDTMGGTIFLVDSFQFRFRNKATLAGDFDHWHVDYVYLDWHRSQIADTLYNDVTFGGVPTPYLKNYSAMPYRQYQPTDTAKNSVRIQNNYRDPVPLNYEHKVFQLPNYNQVAFYNGGNNQLAPFRSNGYSHYGNHAHPSISTPSVGYAFPAMTSMTDYEIQHYVYRSADANSDFIVANDTVLQFQFFENYYALDDGSAEAGYYVNGQGGQMAMKTILSVPDTLQALRIYFDPVGYGYANPLDTLLFRFTINVWAADNSNNNAPSNQLVYTDTYTRSAQYDKNFYKLMPEYPLSHPLVLNAGTYYIGIQQKYPSGIAIGFDMNTDHHEMFYFNSGGGWIQSGFHGSPMIRPVFGALKPVGINESQADKNKLFQVYPNPSSGQFLIASEHFENASYQLMNALGQTLLESRLTQAQQLVSTGSLSDGVYFLVIKDGNNRLVQQQKLILQR